MVSPEICFPSYGADVAFLRMNEAAGESSRGSPHGSLRKEKDWGANIEQGAALRRPRLLASLGT